MIWSNIVEGISELGSQWLGNKKQIAQAKAEYKIAVFTAKADLASQTLSQTFTLDQLAVKEAAKTWWDEFLVLLFLSPFVYTCLFYPFYNAGGLVPPSEIWTAIENVEDWYKYGLALIGVRYLGFRTLLMKVLEHRLETKKHV